MDDKNGKLTRKRKIMLAVIFLAILGLEGAFFYGAFTGSDTVVNGFISALTFFISWAGFASVCTTSRSLEFMKLMEWLRMTLLTAHQLHALRCCRPSHSGN